ncbi:MAG TPA: type II toxin-antitoxin system HipA family toxin [Phenylobacterium sp.]|jgi:serine/threonine-protein kinase HipA|nr:type II toxin-antitoxin system HipA family toxin [Phenylobacterium sp.]
MPAGRVAMDGGLAQLEWSRDVLATRLPVAALYYPPEPGLQAARGRAFEGLQGFLADSLPEGWGRRLMRRRLERLGVDIATLSPLDQLALVGRHGRGALVYEPATTPAEGVETLDLDALAAEAAAILAGEEGTLADTLADLAGGSGGARPKVHVGFNAEGKVSVGEGELPEGFIPWLVKFRAPNDPDDIGPIEEAYADMAEAAGLAMSEHRLIPARQGPGYFATRRFDRTDGGGRLHMVSLAGAVEAPSEPGIVSYDTFLRATQAITRRKPDVEAVFRRMVFNILASNRDDHTRQHAYLMDAGGDWRLAPAYDLTYAPGPGGEHYLDIEGEGRNPTRAHVLRLGARHSLDAKAVAAMVEEVRAAMARWPAFGDAAGVTKASAKEIATAHARVWAAFDV